MYFKIASTKAHNGLLDKEAYILETLKKEADLTEAEYARINPDKPPLNYHFLFPSLVESFISEEQNKRRVNILGFFDVSKKLSDLVPLSHVVKRDRVRIDPRTSAWILGKLLKMLDFTHTLGISNGMLNGENILINPAQHFVTISDWTRAMIENPLHERTIAKEISEVTGETILALAGSTTTAELPPDDFLTDNQYQDLLKGFLLGKEVSAEVAHKKFYTLIRSLWPREFYNFKTYPIH